MINTEKLCRKFQKEHQVLIMSLTEHNKIYLTLERRYKQLSQWPVESRRSSRKKSGKRSRRKKLQVREFTSDLEHFYQQYHHIIIQIDGLLSAKVANDLAGHMFDQSLLRQVQAYVLCMDDPQMTQRFEDVIQKSTFAANDSMKLILNTWPYIQAMSTPCAVNTLGITASLEDFKSWFITPVIDQTQSSLASNQQTYKMSPPSNYFGWFTFRSKQTFTNLLFGYFITRDIPFYIVNHNGLRVFLISKAEKASV